MAIQASNLIKSKSEYLRSYDASGGFGYTENMYIDRMSEVRAIESIPGFRRIYDFGEKISGIYLQNVGADEKYLVVHSGRELYRFEINERDGLSALTPISTLSSDSSHVFEYGDDLYVMDGEGITKIGKDGVTLRMEEEGELTPYIPTTYVDCEACEERNYLTDKFYQRIHIKNSEDYRIYSDNLTFSIIDQDKKLCAVTGLSFCDNYFDLSIPPTAMIDGTLYRVTEIADNAFRNCEYITAVYTANTLEYIGKHAFDGCVSIDVAVLSDTVRALGYRAFYGTTTLADMYIGLGFEEFGEECLTFIHQYGTLYYAGDEESTENITGKEHVEPSFVRYNRRNDNITIGLPVMGDVLEINRATLGNIEISTMINKKSGMIIIPSADKYELIGKEVVFYGTFKPIKLRSILRGDRDEELSPWDIIPKCTLGTAHDGRIFLSGNPDLPGAVFYSSKDMDGNYRPLYFAESDFFVDGVSNYPITSLLSAHGTLTVFKSEDDGSGSIFCHTADTDSKGRRTYPLTYTHGGVSVPGGSYTLYDDALFLSSRGVCALEKVAGSNYRALRNRSTEINKRILEEDLADVKLTEWQDYLVMSSGGDIYLGDSADRRDGEFSFEYKWYYLSGIGTYSGAKRVYRYAEGARDGFSIKLDRIGERAVGTVMSISVDGELVYYVESDGVKHEVYPTDEMYGGDFSPAVSILGVGELLFFGTESGSLCVFNNDKRGTPPPYVREDPSFDSASYSELSGSSIHPYYYTFDGHAVSYVLKTECDGCGIPHLEKRTVPHSLLLNAKTYPRSRIDVRVRTDGGSPKELGRYDSSRLSFADTDFGSFTFSSVPYVRIPINERECGWMEKELTLQSCEFRTPIGIISLIYRFAVKGNLKER